MDGSAAESQGSVERAREQYLTLLLSRLESGSLEAYEYTRRVQAVEKATTADQMAEIVSAEPRPEPVLDPVDLMELARQSSKLPSDDKKVKWLWPVVVGAFLIVLMGVGIWLVNHANALHNSGGGVVTDALLVAAGASAIGAVVA